MRKRYSMLGFIGKCVLLFFLVIYFFSMTSLLWESATEDVMWENDEARRLSSCEEDLREKQYGELWDYMELYELYDSKYDKYWEAVENRMEELQTIQAQKAGEN